MLFSDEFNKLSLILLEKDPAILLKTSQLKLVQRLILLSATGNQTKFSNLSKERLNHF
jgi:hypothetical protein